MKVLFFLLFFLGGGGNLTFGQGGKTSEPSLFAVRVSIVGEGANEQLLFQSVGSHLNHNPLSQRLWSWRIGVINYGGFGSKCWGRKKNKVPETEKKRRHMKRKKKRTNKRRQPCSGSAGPPPQKKKKEGWWLFLPKPGSPSGASVR